MGMVVVKIGPNSETRKSDKGEFVGSGCSPPHKLGGKENAVSSRSGVWGKAPAIWQFRTFYRLTKPLLVSILLTLNLFSEIFVGVRAIEDPTTKFCGAGPPQDQRLRLQTCPQRFSFLGPSSTVTPQRKVGWTRTVRQCRAQMRHMSPVVRQLMC